MIKEEILRRNEELVKEHEKEILETENGFTDLSEEGAFVVKEDNRSVSEKVFDSLYEMKNKNGKV